MMGIMKTLTPHQSKDIRIIARFTQVWCKGHRHENRQTFPLPDGLKPVELCRDCSRFVSYAISRRMHCPLEAEKPSCKHCRIHCYAPAERELVKRIMAWSGRRMILRGRLDYLWHYFF